jgi:hypothetical protein
MANTQDVFVLSGVPSALFAKKQRQAAEGMASMPVTDWNAIFDGIRPIKRAEMET